MDRRRPKKTDQEQIQKGIKLIKECMAKHPEIEPTLWGGAIWNVLIECYILEMDIFNMAYLMSSSPENGIN